MAGSSNLKRYAVRSAVKPVAQALGAIVSSRRASARAVSILPGLGGNKFRNEGRRNRQSWWNGFDAGSTRRSPVLGSGKCGLASLWR
jgi:hypothetical protein